MPKLIAEKRNTNTKAAVLRQEGKLPAVFYGRKTKATSISLEQGEFIKTWKDAGESTIIDLSYNGKEVSVLIHDVALDPVKETPLHVDFMLLKRTGQLKFTFRLNLTVRRQSSKKRARQ